jgi:hypothetical protein
VSGDRNVRDLGGGRCGGDSTFEVRKKAWDRGTAPLLRLGLACPCPCARSGSSTR